MNTTSGGRWELEVRGLRIQLGERAVVIGRDPTCELPIDDHRVSWRHVRLELRDGFPLVTDLGSTDGTFIDGARTGSGPIALTAPAIIQVGGLRARVREIEPERPSEHGRFRRLPLRSETLRIGRAPDNDVVLNEPNISWHHAQLRPGMPPTVVDLGSRNGVRVGSEMIRGERPLPPE